MYKYGVERVAYLLYPPAEPAERPYDQWLQEHDLGGEVDVVGEGGVHHDPKDAHPFPDPRCNGSVVEL